MLKNPISEQKKRNVSAGISSGSKAKRRNRISFLMGDQKKKEMMRKISRRRKYSSASSAAASMQTKEDSLSDPVDFVGKR